MSTKTPNYSLVKPALGDPADITAMNQNWDTLDTNLRRVDVNAKDHADSKDNPHGVTKAQVGLGAVDNTSDANKPISTATQEALNGKQDTITGAASTIADGDLAPNRALVSNASGKVAVSPVTDTELGYLDGVTSNVQTQLNGKQATVNGGASSILNSNLSAGRALVSNSSGKVAASAVTATELGYLDGVTSPVQTQMDGKVAKAGDTLTGMLTFENVNDYHALMKYRNVNSKPYGVNFGCGILGGEGVVTIECRAGNSTTSPILGRVEIGSRGVSFVDANDKRTYLVSTGLTAASVE